MGLLLILKSVLPLGSKKQKRKSLVPGLQGCLCLSGESGHLVSVTQMQLARLRAHFLDQVPCPDWLVFSTRASNYSEVQIVCSMWFLEQQL